MRDITVMYHREEGSWWADSADVPGFSAAADSFEELRGLVKDGLSFHFDDEPVRVRLIDESGAALDAQSAFTPPRAGWWTKASGDLVGWAAEYPSRTAVIVGSSMTVPA